MQDSAPAIGRYVRSLLGPELHPSSPTLKGGDTNPVQVYMDLLHQLLSAIGGKLGGIVKGGISAYDCGSNYMYNVLLYKTLISKRASPQESQ